jgi:hypothetical protein
MVSDIKKRHRLTFFENRVLRRMFGPNREKETRGIRKLSLYLVLSVFMGFV